MSLTAQESRSILGFDTQTAKERRQEEYLRRRILDRRLTEDKHREDQDWAEEYLATRTPTTAEIQAYVLPLETKFDFALPARLRVLRSERLALIKRYLSLLRPGMSSRHVTQLESCGTVWKVWRSETEYQVHPNRCHCRDCPECQDLRRRLWYHRFKQAINLWLTPKHLTLTIKASDAPLRDQLDRLMSCFRRLRSRKMWTESPRWGLYVVEIKWMADTQRWHPHLHIMFNSKFLPWQKIKAAWYKITGDSDCVWITVIGSDLASHISAYVTKSNNCWKAPVNLFHLSGELKGRRLVSKFGKWPIDCRTKKPKLACVGTIRTLAERASHGDHEAISIMNWLLHHHAYAIKDTLLPTPMIFTASDPSPPQRSLRLN